MNANARKWVAALRSGKFPQGREGLNKNGRLCCLGVACELYAETHPEFTVIDHGTEKSYEGNSGSLPNKVREWLGLADDEGTYDRGSLVDLNDSGRRNFAYIADRIEAEPKGLFK